jgi:hypothetical protein
MGAGGELRMINTGNMALTVWDQILDDFDYGQLEENWIAIDQHDHSSGKGIRIGTASIAPDAITNALLAPNSVGSAQLQDNSVSTADIQALAITNALLAPNSVQANVIQDGAVGAKALDPTLIPLGTVQNWWRPPGSVATPGGMWEIMDGRAWSTITNAWSLTTGNIPDMRGQFVQGADVLGTHGPAIGVSGGANTASLAHSHNVNSHLHGVPDHNHWIDHSGTHGHNFYNGLVSWSRRNAINPNVFQLRDYNGSAVDVLYYSIYLKGLTSAQPSSPFYNNGLNDGPTPIDQDGDHNHGGMTQGMMTALNTTAAGTGTDSQLGTVNTVPQNTGLLFIMRCR